MTKITIKILAFLAFGFIFLYGLHSIINPITPESLTSDQIAWEKNLNNLAKKDLSYIEYFPGGIFFFSFTATITQIFKSISFVSTVVGLNFSLLAIYILLLQKISDISERKLVLLLLCYGVIILFRFDLLVALLLIASILLIKKSPIASALFLGLAITTKIFPIIYIPYILFKVLKKNKLWVLYLVITISTIVSIFLLESLAFQISTPDLLKASLGYQIDKPIDIQSIIGTTMYLIHKSAKVPIEIFVTGIWGFYADQSLFKVIPNFLFDYLWSLPVIISSLLLKRTNTLKDIFRSFILITTTFLIFSKMLPPQYFFWWMLLLPFAQINSKKIYFLTLLLGIINQLVYPTTFHSLIFAVQDNRIDHSVIILITRQLVFLYFYVTLIWYYIKNNWLHFSWPHFVSKNNTRNN